MNRIMLKKYTLYFLLIILISSCATTKSRNDQSKLAQFYHNLTSKFNGYFNANELLEESVYTLNNQYVDNYNELLPIYKYTEVENADAVKSDLDEAIKKVSVVVTLHEYSDFADDCYLLIGKSNFLKKDYESAQNALEFYMDEFKPNGKRYNIKPKKKKKRTSPAKRSNTSKSKKKKSSAKTSRASKQAAKERKRYNKQVKKAQKKRKKGKGKSAPIKPPADLAKKPAETKDGAPAPPSKDVSAPKSTDKKLKIEKEKKPKPEEKENGMLGHKPAYQSAILWLARTFIARENYIAADFNLVKLEKMPALQDDVVSELPIVRAQYYIERGNYEAAIERLSNGIELAKKKQDKARYTFIIGQLYQKMNQRDKAANSFAEVIKMNTNYEMEFNARLQALLNGIESGTTNYTDAESKLNRMIKDFKNEEYLDQLYYVIAKIALKQNDIVKAIDNLKLSVDSPGRNPAQKVESNYLLAELEFNRENYVEAKGAFDAALSGMEKSDERYDYTKLMSENLTDIAKYITTITEKDSLLQIAELSPEEQEAYAKKIVKLREKEADLATANQTGFNKSAAKGRSSTAMQAKGQIPSVRTASNTTASSSFFAYDTKRVKKGVKDFSRTWGDIPLGNHWRIRSKAVSVANVDGTTGGLVVEEIVSSNDIESILKSVPSTQEEKEAAHTEIRSALLALGRLYREKLEDYPSSIEVLEKLISKYPQAIEKMEAYYELYLTYTAAGNSAQAEIVKQKLISEFSTSKYAKALSDPDYAKNQITERQKLINYYDEIYEQFDAEQYQKAKEMLSAVPEKFGASNPMSSKFALLSAFNTGSLDGEKAYIDALKDLIAQYPKTDEEKKARDILLLLGQTASGKTFGAKNLNKANFIPEPDKAHFVLVYIKNQKDVALRDAKISIANYNRQYHSLDKLRITSLIFNPSTKESIILLRSFPDKTKALEYTQGLFRKQLEFLPEGADFVSYAITQNNYREIIKARSIEDYEAFYQEHYGN